MYIHNYQIHNVLNEYRKQLSRCQAPVRKKASTAPETRDHIMLSDEVQRQSIIEQVSSDIVERIKNSNAHKTEDRDLLGRYPSEAGDQQPGNIKREKEFTYTLIDEFNRKKTHKLPVRNLKPLSHLPKFIQEKMDRLAMDAPDMGKRSLGIG